MRWTALLALTFWPLAAPLAQAGAWLREDGAGMLAFSQEIAGSGANYSSVYAEYGLNARMTLGLDAGKGEAAEDWKAVVFLRMGREFEWLPGRVAAELGLGAAGAAEGGAEGDAEGGAEGVLQSGLSWGNSFQTGLGWAWVNLDAKGIFHLAAASETAPPSVAGLPMALTEGYKLDLTLGLNLSERMQVSLEMRFEDPAEGADSLRLVPAIARRVGRRGWISLGAIVGLDGSSASGLVLGSRVEF
ncbi:hypothetical protein [Rhodovulum steppense]|uniref:Transporter n=1 Tax=Rhodovulum steppense TaxID=540251 RepID=A0A4R1Z2V5_9RHOB|nr:hypothetical protein [Rhodovulum steppense]TCM87999.1 hypothetical protein EV216_1019 [Rhodovulum steppense]